MSKYVKSYFKRETFCLAINILRFRNLQIYVRLITVKNIYIWIVEGSVFCESFSVVTSGKTERIDPRICAFRGNAKIYRALRNVPGKLSLSRTKIRSRH